MRKISFNKDWKCSRKGEDKFTEVEIPHDAMLLDERSEDSIGGTNIGWYNAHDYTYVKNFFVSEDDRENYLYLEFEGVYHKASIYINDKKVGYHDYGYTGFTVNLNDHIKYGSDNVIRVEATNSDQPNSRWYSGTGIYRPVWMYRLPKLHIKHEGVKIVTTDYRSRSLHIEVQTNGKGKLKLEILDGNAKAAEFEEFEVKDTKDGIIYKCDVHVPELELWSTGSPKLYKLKAYFEDDIAEESFGVREISASPDSGFCINGERVILRGACIHHDNGILGACAYDFAERRKVKLLKENGYNAIRSAHNPCSKAMLKACDDMGMLVMDEYVDVWYIHKTKNDYAGKVETNYREDLAALVSKDFNHPSVIMYSTGNEVSETAQKRGIELCGAMTEYLHFLDSSRPVSCGVNIFFNFLSSMGFGVYSDKKAEAEASGKSKKKAVGSEFFNNLAGLLGANFMKCGATIYPCDVKTRDAYANMDIAGYNYGIFRYKHDLKKYPNRLILGSETFCSDAYDFWKIANKEPRIIGDFVWAGMDYLGELGVGAWEYEEYAPDFSHGNGWLTAGSGRIDITGKPLAEMTYTKVAFGIEKLGIAVVPLNGAGKKHSPSAWKMTNAIESWSWRGYEGIKTQVEVYSRAARVELYLNGVKIAEKKPDKHARCYFDVEYQNGELTAKSFDKEGRFIAEKTLKTGGKDIQLRVEPENDSIKVEGDLAYVRLKYTDDKGEVQPLARGDISVEVENGELIGLGSACPYYENSYKGNIADTYYGEALAVLKPISAGKMKITAKSKYGNCTGTVEITVN